MEAPKSSNAAVANGNGPFAELIVAAQAGDELAFGQLYESFRPRVAKFLFNATGDYWLADELTNDTFLRAHGALANLRQTRESSFLSFLFRISANLLCDHLRHKSLPRVDMGDDYWFM